MGEAVSLVDHHAEFAAEHSDVPFSFLVVVFEESLGETPSAQTAVDYAEAIDWPDFPVAADTDDTIINNSPWEGNALPGKCVLTPDMEILQCYTGHGNETAFDAIVEHWESAR